MRYYVIFFYFFFLQRVIHASTRAVARFDKSC